MATARTRSGAPGTMALSSPMWKSTQPFTEKKKRSTSPQISPSMRETSVPSARSPICTVSEAEALMLRMNRCSSPRT